MLAPLNCSNDSDYDEENRATSTSTTFEKTTNIATSSSSVHLQKTPSFSTTNQHVNAPVGSMEGHSSLAAYSQHHHHHHHPHQSAPNFQGPPTGNHTYYHQQHQYGQGTSGDGMNYGNDFDQHHQASTSTSSADSASSTCTTPQHASGQFQPQQHHISPHSAPPQQRNFVPQYPVKVVEPQVNRATVNAKPPAPPPSAPPTMAPRKTPPSSFLKRQPDAQEQQRMDYEVARNVSQIMSKNGMKMTHHAIISPQKPLPPLAPLPAAKSAGSTAYQCPHCSRSVSNARNLQRHLQTCSVAAAQQSQIQHDHLPPPQPSPRLAAMLQRSPPGPSTSAPPPTSSSSVSSTSPSVASTFQHHNSSGNLGGMSAYSHQSSLLYSPHDMMADPNIMLSDGFDFKDDPMLYQGPSNLDDVWSGENSFGTQLDAAPPRDHDQLDLSDPLSFHLDVLDAKESARDYQSPVELDTTDPNPHLASTHYFGIDPELDMPMSLDMEEPSAVRSESASLSSSSHGRNTPATAAFMCDSCKKVVSSERSLRRHYNTCKIYQADLAGMPPEERLHYQKRRPPNGGGAAVKRPRKPKVDEPQQQQQQQKHSAILAALAAPPTHYPTQTNRPPPLPPAGGLLPPISASWLSSNSSSSRSSDIFTPPIASSTPIPSYQQNLQQQQQQQLNHQKSSPLQELLVENEPEEDGDSRSSSGTTTVKPTGNPLYTCEHCSRPLCSMSNLKRHRATCKAAAEATALLEGQAKPVAQPQPTCSQPTSTTSLHVETTATVTYTKTDGASKWQNDGGMLSPKQKNMQTSPDGDWKKTMTVGEALKAKQVHQRMEQSRIPPRPPNPILNQVQNPPQQVQQMQSQSRQAPQSQAQIVHQQLPPLSNSQLHAQLQLQSPKKGVIEVKNTDQVLITSEPLPLAMTEQRRSSLDGQVQVQVQTVNQNQSQSQAQALPPLQLPQRKPQIAYQVQFNGRPLPPMQLPPLQFHKEAAPKQKTTTTTTTTFQQNQQQMLQQQQNQKQQQQQRQMPMMHQTQTQMQMQMSHSNQMPQKPPIQLPPLAMPPKMTHHPMEPPPPAAKRMRASQSTAVKMHSIEESPNSSRQAGSPLDSIITTAPLSVEVNHQLKEPEQIPLSSAESQAAISAPSPRKPSNQQAYICPECEKIYSCRKNVKRHRMAVHKMSLDEVLAKPELPAPDDYVGPVGGASRRHTVAGLDFEKTPSSRSGAKRKASTAVATAPGAPTVAQAAKKPKESQSYETVAPTSAPPTIHQTQVHHFTAQQHHQFVTPDSSAPSTSVQPLPSVHTFQQSAISSGSMALSLPPLQLAPLQDASLSTSNASPNPAPATQMSDEDDAKAMAKIAAELKRCAEKWPAVSGALLEGADDIDEDEALLQHLRRTEVLQDVGDVAHILDGTEADSTFTDEMLEQALGTNSTSSSSAEEQYLQYPHYQHEQQVMWSEDAYSYQQSMQAYSDQQQQQQHPVSPQFQQLQPMQLEPWVQRHHSVAIPPHHQFQEPLVPRPASQPAPRMRPGRRPNENPKSAADLQCSGCKKLLGSEYSLRRHRAGCAEVQNALNPDYPRPPQRRAARKSAKATEMEILASMPRQMGVEQIAMRKAANVERMEKLPAPAIVHEIVAEVNMENKRRLSQMSPDDQPARPAEQSPSQEPTSSSSPPSTSSSSTSSLSTTAECATLFQTRHTCEPCDKNFSSEWNLDRHKRENCPNAPKNVVNKPSGTEGEIAQNGQQMAAF